MPKLQDAHDEDSFAPVSTCKRILTTLWQRAGKEGGQPSVVFEEWVHEVASLANLAEWKREFKQKLRDGANLWLPGEDPQELGVLLAIANLADELGCTVGQLAKALTKLSPGNFEQAVLDGNTRDLPSTMNQPSAGMSPTAEVDQTKLSQNLLAADTDVDYQPLIEALSDWQAMFELALDEAAGRLGPEEFPAKDLSASLAEMCKLLRDVLSGYSAPYKNPQERAI